MNMLQLRSAIEYRDGVAAVVPGIAGVGRIDDEGDRRGRLAAERAVDEILADSFPASDPPSWNPGIARPQPAGGFASAATAAQAERVRLPKAGVIDVSRPDHDKRTFLRSMGSLFGAAGIAVLFVLGIVIAGQGVVQTIAWLFGVDVRW
jgi:hypothetical protein